MSGPGASGPWHPPAPSLAALPVDRSKTEPKPAYYKLQFGDDVTGFSYYVRTLSVVIGRNVERPNAAHASPAPPLASFGIDAPFSGFGWTPPGQAVLATPPTPALDADALAIVESAEFAAVASQWLESGGMNMARIEPAEGLDNFDVRPSAARIPLGEDGLGGVEAFLEKGSGPGDDRMEVDADIKPDTGAVEHPGLGVASTSLTPAPSSASMAPAAGPASASASPAPAIVPSPSPDNTIPVGNTAVDLTQQAAIAEPTIPSTFPAAPPEAALPDTVPTLDEKDALDLGIDAASFLVGDIEELDGDADVKPDFSELAGFDGSELPPPPPPKPTVHLEHVDVDLGPLKSVSRNHAKIEYRSDCGQFCLEIFGRNGAWVDDRYYVKGTVVPLNQGSQIQIATRIFSFVLPPSQEGSPTQTQAVSDAMDGAYPYEQLPYPYNLPPEQVGYAEFYGEGGPGPATAATMAARVPAFNAFAASDGYGLGAEPGRFADHEWIEDEWQSGRSDEDDDSSDDDDYEDDDEDEEDEDDDDDDEQVAPRKMVIRLKARRVIADDDDDSSLSELSSEPEPEPEPENEPKKVVVKKKIKKEAPVTVKAEPDESPRKAGKGPVKGRTGRKGVKAPTLVLKPPEDKAKKKGKKDEVKTEGAMDVDTSRAATPTPDQTTQTTPKKVKKESKVKEGKIKKKEKAAAAAAMAATTPSAAAPTPIPATATQPKPAPRPHGLALPNLAAVEAAKKAKEAQAAQAAAAATAAAAAATQPLAAPTLAAAMSQPAAAPTPQVPPQPATLAAAQAQPSGAPATLAQVAAAPAPGVPGAPGAAGVRPPHPSVVRPPGVPSAPGIRPPAHGLALPAVRPPQAGQPQPGVPGAAPGAMPARPGMPMRPGMPGQPHPGMQVRPGQPLPPGVRPPPPGMVVRPGMPHPGAPGVARPPMRPPPGRGQQVNAPADPPKPYFISELRENPLRAGHILCSVPIPPSGAGPRQPPANILGLDGNLFIGPPPLKPTATFATIIHRALTNLPRGRGTLGEVCNWVAGEWEYFRLNPEAGWQNSIRHNLSLNKAFLKVPRIPEDDPESKGSVWILDPEEGPLFEEKQRRDALKSEGKAKNAEEKRMRERMKAEERARKQREREVQMAQQAQMMRQAGAVPAAGVGGVRPRPPPVQSANRGVLPAKGKITVVIRPVDATMRAKSVIDKMDASGVPLPFVCDGTTLVLDQATFGHLTADIVDKLQLLGAAGAVDVLSAWVVNKNKQAAAKAATKPPVRPGLPVRPGAPPVPAATAVRPPAAAARPPATKPAVGATGKPLPGPAPPGANLTKVISMIAEVAHARGDVNTVGPNASALLRYIRVVGVDIDLRVAERIWATGVVPPLPPKKPAANGAKPGAPVRPPAARPPAAGVRPPPPAGAGAGAGALRPPTPTVRPPVAANGVRPPPNGVARPQGPQGVARPPAQPGQAPGQTPAGQAAQRPSPAAPLVQAQPAAAGPAITVPATTVPAAATATATAATATAATATATATAATATTAATTAAAPTAGVKRAFDQGPGAPAPATATAANGVRPPPAASAPVGTPAPTPAAATAPPRPPPAAAPVAQAQTPAAAVAAPARALPAAPPVQAAAAGEDPAAKKPRLEPPTATV